MPITHKRIVEDSIAVDETGLPPGPAYRVLCYAAARDVAFVATDGPIRVEWFRLRDCRFRTRLRQDQRATYKRDAKDRHTQGLSNVLSPLSMLYAFVNT